MSPSYRSLARKFAPALVLALLVWGGIVTTASTALAHHGDLTATTECVDGERVVTWSQGWANVPKRVTGTVTSRTGNGPVVERGTAQGREGRIEWTVTYPGDTTTTPWEWAWISFDNGHKIDSARRVEGITPCVQPAPEPEPTNTPDPEPEPTPTETPTPTPSPEPSPSPESSPSPSPEPTSEPSPTPTPTSEPEPEPTEKPAPTPGPTPSPEPTLVPPPNDIVVDDELDCPEGKAPGWLDEDSNPTGCVDDDPTGPELAETGPGDVSSALAVAALLVLGGGLLAYKNARRKS